MPHAGRLTVTLGTKIETQRQAPHAGQLTRPARTNLRVHENGAGTVTRGPAVGNFGDGWSRNYSRKGKSIDCQVVRHVFPEIAETKDSDLEIDHVVHDEIFVGVEFVPGPQDSDSNLIFKSVRPCQS